MRYSVTKSPSSRGRGLKFFYQNIFTNAFKSPSSRGRGLKSNGSKDETYNPTVALFTRAWIEICLSLSILYRPFVSPSSRGRGLKFKGCHLASIFRRSPSSRGRGLKYPTPAEAKNLKESPSSRGRGLK